VIREKYLLQALLVPNETSITCFSAIGRVSATQSGGESWFL